MKDFIKNEKVTVFELDELRHRLLTELGWSYESWRNKRAGRTEFTKTDYFACKTLLEDIRLEEEQNEQRKTEQ